MASTEPCKDSMRHWYIVDQNGEFTLRINSGLIIGEIDNGTLVLEPDVSKHRCLRFYINKKAELWASIVNPRFNLRTNSEQNLIHHELVSGCKLMLPNSTIIISDVPFMPSASSLFVEVTPVQAAVKENVKTAPEPPIPTISSLLSTTTSQPTSLAPSVLAAKIVDATTARARGHASLAEKTPSLLDILTAQDEHTKLNAKPRLVINAPLPPPARPSNNFLFYGIGATVAAILLTLFITASSNDTHASLAKSVLDEPLLSAEETNTPNPVVIEAPTLELISTQNNLPEFESTEPVTLQLSVDAQETDLSVAETPSTEEVFDKTKQTPALISENEIPSVADWRLTRATEKMEQGNIISPYGDNAVLYLTSFLLESPNHPEAIPLIKSCAKKLITIAEQQQLSGSTYAARNTLEEVFAFDSSNEEAQALWIKWHGKAWHG